MLLKQPMLGLLAHTTSGNIFSCRPSPHISSQINNLRSTFRTYRAGPRRISAPRLPFPNELQSFLLYCAALLSAPGCTWLAFAHSAFTLHLHYPHTPPPKCSVPDEKKHPSTARADHPQAMKTPTRKTLHRTKPKFQRSKI